MPQNAGLIFGTLHGQHLLNEPRFLFVMFLLDLKQVAKLTLSQVLGKVKMYYKMQVLVPHNAGFYLLEFMKIN